MCGVAGLVGFVHPEVGRVVLLIAPVGRSRLLTACCLEG